jgi:L-arabinonolactonase
MLPNNASIGYWIDSLGTAIHSCDREAGAVRSWKTPEHIGSLALREGGGAIVALRDGFYTLDFATGATRKAANSDPGKPRTHLNDGEVDRQGRFVAGYGSR